MSVTRKRMIKTIHQRIEEYRRTGGCRVRWWHHPKEVRDAIRRAGLQPMMKKCWRNSQRLFISDHQLEGLTYHEGWASGIITFEHAWLRYKGEILDLTIDSSPAREPVHYPEKYLTYTLDELLEVISTHMTWGPVNQTALTLLNPKTELINYLLRKRTA